MALTHKPKGPGEPWQLLFSEMAPADPQLPPEFLELYPGDWQIPEIKGRPYIYSDFAISRDGRITYKEEGYVGGSDITDTNTADWWFMAFLRTRADGIMNGAGTSPMEHGTLWTAEDLFPGDAEAFKQLREYFGHPKPPIVCVLTHDGQIGYDQPTMQIPEMHVVVATSTAGADYACEHAQQAKCQVDIQVLGEQFADIKTTVDMLYSDYGVRNLLSEGGSTVQAGLLQAGLLDEEFVTWCPSFVGRSDAKFRPSYTEGVAWHPTNAPYSKPLTLHKSGDLLYLRTQVQYK